MIDQKRTAAVERDDLRNRMVACGDCSVEEDMSDSQHDEMKRDIRRIDTELDSHERETDRAITALSTHFEHISSTLDSQAKLLSQIDKRMGALEGDIKKYNNMRERLDGIERVQESMAQDYVPRPEFNGAINSVREFVKEKVDGLAGRFALLMWIIGAGFGVTFTALGFLIFGGG